jgi:3-oxoacyl-[acyl-carrier protein] reductase
MNTPTRTVVITGAASGIGAATVRRLAAPDTALVLHTRQNLAGLQAVAAAAEAAGSQTELVTGDLADPSVPLAIIAAARARFGRVDQIVSNAAKAKLSSYGAMSEADLELAFSTMPMAFARLTQAALVDLAASPWARVVAVSSFVAHSFGTAGLLFPATAAGKAALEALAKGLAVELAPSGGTSNIVVPGFTRKDAGGHAATPSASHVTSTQQIPLGQFASPDDVAGAIAYFLSRDAAHVTGTSLHVNGGLLLR